ncbi:hypothetical protein SAMN04487976_107220 [Xaviernesmea oryzae]|nr:hypothetical protein SAMN04487976_107220 [Xaviernesmea oryzae]
MQYLEPRAQRMAALQQTVYLALLKPIITTSIEALHLLLP